LGSLQGLWIQNSRIYIISVLQHDLRASNWAGIDLQISILSVFEGNIVHINTKWWLYSPALLPHILQ
jgi:hypothetical protein